MMVHFRQGSPLGKSYSRTGATQADTIRAWPAGSVRDVDEDLATYLIVTFPECFELPEDAPEAPVPSTGDDAGDEPSAVLGGTVAEIRAALDAGALDGDLQQLLDAERAGKGRSTLIAAIEARASAREE